MDRQNATHPLALPLKAQALALTLNPIQAKAAMESGALVSDDLVVGIIPSCLAHWYIKEENQSYEV